MGAYRTSTQGLRGRLLNTPSLLGRALVAGATSMQHGRHVVRHRRQNADKLSADASGWMEEVRRAGFTVIPDFVDRAWCEASIDEVERVFDTYPHHVQRRSDRRVFGAETQSEQIRQFAQHPDLLAVAGIVFGEPTENAYTLAARIDAAPGNLGSGEGWHRDAAIVQFKAVLYLTDVSEKEGPFQLITGSERLSQLVVDTIRSGFGFNQSRITDKQVADLVRAAPARLRTVTASAGTLILVNTSAIHRGSPIDRGTRYALTNYYFPTRRIDCGLHQHFAPVLTAATIPAAYQDRP